MTVWIRLAAIVQIAGLLTASPVLAQTKTKAQASKARATTRNVTRTAARGPQFKIPAPGILQFPTGIPGQPYTFDLRTLLAVTGEPPLRWEISGAPTWLKLDSDGGKVTGDPAAANAGVAKFKLSVQDSTGEGGEIDREAEVVVFAPPTFTIDKIDLGIQNEGQTDWSFDLKPFVSNPAGGTLTFDATGLRPWMSLDKNTGILTGVPQRADVGKYNGITVIAKGVSGQGTAGAYGEVRLVIKAPKWIKKEITLENAKEDSAYSRNLVEFVINPDPLLADLNYEIVSETPPPWLSMGKTSGNLFGTPGAKNVGNISVTIRLFATYNGKTYDDTSVFKFTVVHTNHAPQWLSKPLNLPQGATGVVYNQDLSKSATDVDKDKLTYTIVSFNGPGAAWAKIDPNTGVLSGTPNKDNVGDNSFVVKVEDPGGLSDITTVQFKVIKSNEPPYWLAVPTILVSAKEDQTYGIDLNNYAKDPDSDKLTFTPLDDTSWLTVNANGIVTGKPGKSNLGLTKFTVRVADGISGSAISEIQVFVEHTNHAPYWTQNPITFSVKEREPLPASINILGYAKDDDDGDTLTMSLIEGKPWATLDPKTGQFSGTPVRDNVGANTFKVRLADSAGLTADVVVIINVIKVNQAPYWEPTPVVLANAKERQAYSASLWDFAKDPDIGDTKRFVLLSGAPAWVRVSPDGMVTGTPQRSDVGVNEFQVRVLDAANADAVTVVRVTVEKVNQPPRWRQNPIQLGEAYEDTTFAFDLTPYAVDDDGDKLTYKLVSGPSWMFVGQDGKITGTPMKTDLGPFVATFSVSDGQAEAQTTGKGTVVHKNHPPTIAADMPVFEIKERSTRAEDLKKWVKDSDGDVLHFVLESTSDFVKLADDGTLTMEPKFKHIGDHTLNFKVNDAEIAIHGQIKIKVIRDPRPPVWLTDPIRFEGKTNEAFVNSVAGEARDLDGLRITFRKKSGPVWLTVDSEGGLKGTPRQADLGLNAFVLEACNDVMCTTEGGNVLIDVKVGTQVDVVQVDTADPNAQAEYTWVIDNSKWCDKVIVALKKYINVFYSAMSVIQHKGIYLSADAFKHDGTPIRVANGPLLIDSNNNPAQDFLKRLDSGISEDRCGNCNNSPIWSLFRFTQKVVGMSEIYHNGYVMPGLGTDAMMVSQQRDHFPTFTKNKPEMKNWKAEDFADAYKKFYASEQQSFRANAMAPKCPKLSENGTHGEPSAPENAYRTVVDATGGKYYATGCDFNMEAALKDYAQRIIFRAYVHAKHTIKLSKTPIQVANTMKVRLGDQELPGNTGADTDYWYYDQGTNSVKLRWHLIDQGQIKPGDKVSVEYRVS